MAVNQTKEFTVENEALRKENERLNLLDQLSTGGNVQAANGTAIPLLGEVTLRIRVGDFTTSIAGLVTEHVSEVMIGIDWMTANRAIWDFGMSRLRIEQRCFTMRAYENDGFAFARIMAKRYAKLNKKEESMMGNDFRWAGRSYPIVRV